MSQNLYGSICLSDIPKQYITTGKNGKKYIAINVWENREPDRFGNSHSIQVAVPVEDRQRDHQKYYLGNLKTRVATKHPDNSPFAGKTADNDNDLPSFLM